MVCQARTPGEAVCHPYGRAVESAPPPAKPKPARPSFTYKTARSDELRTAAQAVWNDAKVRRRALLEVWLQIPFAFGMIFGPYALLMLTSPSRPEVLVCLAAICLGAIAMGGLFHDSNHRAVFSPIGLPRTFDYLLAWLSSDVTLGTSGYHWANKHEVHHSNTNILGHDGDLDLEPALRVHPEKRFYRLARYQHLYAWLLYPFMLVPLHIRGHWVALVGGEHGSHPLKRARGWQLAGTLAGMAIFYLWALVGPIEKYGLDALWSFFAVAAVVGFVYGLAFQLAHCVDTVEFPTVESLQQQGERKEGFVHQLETTANFCPNNALLRWFLGGLTHQTEHHLFRRYPHPFYRHLAPVVEQWCQKHNVVYNVQPTLWKAVKSHYALLRDLGRQGQLFELEMG